MKTKILKLLIIAVLMICAYTTIANAVDNTEIAKITINGKEISAFYEGIRLYANPKYEDFTGSTVDLSLFFGYASTFDFCGVQAEVNFEGAVPYDIAETKSDYWEVTSFNIEDNKITFLVEPTADALTSGDWERKDVNVRIKYNADTSNNQDVYVWLNKDNFKITHPENEVDMPLKNVSDVAYDFSVSPLIQEGGPVTPKAASTSAVRVEGHNIYAKLSSNQETGLVSIFQLIDLLNIHDSWTSFKIDSDTIGGRAVFDRSIIGTDIERAIRENEDGAWSLGNVTKLVVECDYGTCEYNVYEMGNTYIDDVYVGGVININDVVYFRQAVVGIESALNDPNFRVEATDVNFSNEELGTLGDIGDIIAIRERILTGKWSDATTEIILDGTYYNTETYFIFNEDGTVTRGSNYLGSSMRLYEGTYSTIDEDTFEVSLTSSTVVHFSGEDATVEEEDITLTFKYEDDSTVTWINSNGQNVETYTKVDQYLLDGEYYGEGAGRMSFDPFGNVAVWSTAMGGYSNTIYYGTYHTVDEETVVIQINQKVTSYFSEEDNLEEDCCQIIKLRDIDETTFSRIWIVTDDNDVYEEKEIYTKVYSD